MERLAAALDKMHQILTHLSEVLPGASGIGGMLTAMKMDIDASKQEMLWRAQEMESMAALNRDAAKPAEVPPEPKAKKTKAE